MAARTYLNFDLSIELDDEGGITVNVLESPAGEAHEQHDWPFSDQDLEIFLLRVGHTRTGVRKIDSPEMEAARNFGEDLYDAVFSGQIGTSFERSIDEADRQGQGLRVRIRTSEPELSDVPWEFLYSTPLRRFLTISTATPLVRYMEQPRMIPPLAVDEAVRILTMVSSPTDVAELDVEDEWARINDSLSGLTSSGLIEIKRLEEATLTALLRELRQQDYHVFHFIGHGAFDANSDEGVLMFEDDRGRGHKVSGEHLGAILSDHESLRLVVLNSCEGARGGSQDPFGGTAQGLVRQGIPAVIGMQFEITDDAALTFSHDFYAAIADGYPVDAALAEARKAIFASGNDVEWGTPVLHMRTPDGRIFDKIRSEQPPTPAEPDDLSPRLAEAQRSLDTADYDRAVVLLESVVRDHPDSTIAADQLAAAKRSLRADRLYGSARVLFEAEQWEAVVDGFAEIREIDPTFADPDGLEAIAEGALAKQQGDARHDKLYGEATAAATARNWDEAVRLLGEISAENVGYRDVSDLLDDAMTRRDAAVLLAAAADVFDSEDWQGVIGRFDEMRLLGAEYAEDPDGLESRARARLDEVEQRRRLQAEHDAAIALVEDAKWVAALQIIDQIKAEAPDYPGIDKLRSTVMAQAGIEEVAETEEPAETEKPGETRPDSGESAAPPVTPKPTLLKIGPVEIRSPLMLAGAGLILIVGVIAVIVILTRDPSDDVATPDTTAAPNVETTAGQEATTSVPEVATTAAPPPDTTFEGIELTAGGCDYGGSVNSISALDEHTVEFALCDPDPAFTSRIAFETFGIQPLEHLEATGGAPLGNPIGTGPYVFAAWDQGERIVYSRFDDYYSQPAAQETLVLTWLTDEDERLGALRAGVTDGVTFPPEQEYAAIAADPLTQLLVKPAGSVMYVGINNLSAPFDDVRIRRAIALGIDRQQLVDVFWRRGSAVAGYFTPCEIEYGCVGDAWYPFDPDQGRQLLAEAGFPDGFTMTIYYRDVFRSHMESPAGVAAEIAAQLEQNLNIEAELVVMESGDFINQMVQGTLDGLHLMGWTGDFPHITNYLDFHFSEFNAQFGEPYAEIYEPIDAAAGSVDPATVGPLYATANNAITDLVPMVPIAHPADAFAASASVQGAYAPPFGAVNLSLWDNGSDTLTFTQRAEPLSLYCADETDSESLLACAQIVESLYSYGPNGEVFPQLAEQCVANDSLDRWTCTLRRGVLFHDGSAFDANDVVASFAAGLDASSPLHQGNSGAFEYYDYLWNGLIGSGG